MNCKLPILTDSGGYQVFSLSKNVKVNKDAAVFKSPYNGDEIIMTPEKSIKTQIALGSDIMIEDFLGYTGRVKDMDWTYVGDRYILLPM